MSSNRRKHLAALGFAVAAGAMLAGCVDQFDANGPSARSLAPISSATLAQMQALGATETSPILIRTYKKEAEMQIWKKTSSGQYALLKTFPMCRWSGQLGPKTREGDRQAPEGFYTITPGQMNPNSHYYLSFNVGYPNEYDRAYGRTGGTIMVHGACSSAGCFSMTDAQIAEIYAIAREAFNGGQREIQLQSFPFKMTAENLAKHRLDPNIDFWKELKTGSDHFEVTKTEPSVLVCGKHYQFDAKADHDVGASAPCPTLRRNEEIESAVAAKQQADDKAVAELVAKGVRPVRLIYADGGQNPVFIGKIDASREDALAQPPQEVALDDKGQPLDPAIKITQDAESAARIVVVPTPAPQSTTVAAAAPTTSSTGLASTGSNLIGGLFSKVGLGPASPTLQVFEPEQPIPTDAPLPPRRSALLDAPLRMADVHADATAQ